MIGSKECKEKLGISYKSHFTEHPSFKRYLKENKIKNFKNTVDLKLAKNNKILPGETVGYIEYEDDIKSYPLYYKRNIPENIKF